MKKRIALFLTLLLVLSMAVVGCNKKAAPESAADLLKIYESGEENSFSLDGVITMNMGMEAMGLNFDIPVNMEMKMDMAGQNAHGNMSIVMDMGALGGENKINSEMYMEKEEDELTLYVKSDGDSKWSKEKEGSDSQDSQQVTNVVVDLLDGANFDNADFKHDEEAKTYVVTQKFSDMISGGDMESFFGTIFETFGALGIDDESAKEIVEGMGNTDVIYTFDDEECHLQSAKMENMEYSFTTESGGVDMTIKVSMGMDYNYSNYGMIKAEDVAVPDEVKAEAE